MAHVNTGATDELEPPPQELQDRERRQNSTFTACVNMLRFQLVVSVFWKNTLSYNMNHGSKTKTTASEHV